MKDNTFSELPDLHLMSSYSDVDIMLNWIRQGLIRSNSKLDIKSSRHFRSFRTNSASMDFVVYSV